MKAKFEIDIENGEAYICEDTREVFMAAIMENGELWAADILQDMLFETLSLYNMSRAKMGWTPIELGGSIGRVAYND